MHRTQIYLDEDQEQALQRLARLREKTRSEVIREAIDVYLNQPSAEEAELATFKAAIVATAGAAPRLVSGAEFTTASRRIDEIRDDELDTRWHG